MVDCNDLRDLIHFLFVCDEATVLGDRMRVQLAFCMLIMAYTGSRPGTIMQPSYRDSDPGNSGLLYGDFKVQVQKIDGVIVFALVIKFRLRKNHRHLSTYVPM